MEAALGQPPVKGHLTAFEAALPGKSSARLLAFISSSRGLLAAGAGTPPDPESVLPGTFCGMQIAEIHFFSKTSTLTRCGIFLIMPRISGPSLRMTSEFNFLNPRPQATLR
jgi:hypothetical protein